MINIVDEDVDNHDHDILLQASKSIANYTSSIWQEVRWCERLTLQVLK